MSSLFDLAALERAHGLVLSAMPATAQYAWPLLAQRTGCEVWLKHENHTPTGAFKARGALVYLAELSRSGALPARMITATRGNHGQSIPYAAARFGVPVTVLVPEGNSVEKNRAMRGWGATVEVFGRDFDEARVEAARRAQADGQLFVPSYHPALVSGVATYAYELFTAVTDLHTVYVPIGMGSGICGVIRTRDLLGLRTEVVGVVAAGAPAYELSFQAGRVVETPSARTFADGIACRAPLPEVVDIVCRGAARVVSVTDAEIAVAMRACFQDTHNVAEGAGAAALAALMKEQTTQRGRKVAAILTGGNVDTDVFCQVLSGTTPVVA